MKIQEKVAQLQRRAIKEIEDGLDSPDEFTRRRAALDMLSIVAIGISFNSDYEKPEVWKEEFTDDPAETKTPPTKRKFGKKKKEGEESDKESSGE